MDSQRLQNQCNFTQDDDDVKFPLVHIKKMQNIADVRTTVLTEAVEGRKRFEKSELYNRLT